MRGSMRMFLFVLMVLLVTMTVSAQEERMLFMEKTIKPGQTIVKYDNVVYRIFSRTSLSLTFSRIDNRYVRLHAEPAAGTGYQPYYEFSIQWSSFPANLLDFSSPGGGTYTLDTETGYAEK